MIILILSTPAVSAEFTLDAGDWQIATDLSFSNSSLVAESLGDTNNKTTKIFDIALDPDVSYYARGRHVFNKFIGEWSDIDLLEVKDTIDVSIETEFPAHITTPNVSLDFDLKNVPNSFFTITTSNISSTTNTKHLATNYTITDVNGKIHFSSLNNVSDLNKLYFKDNVLETDKTYILSVSHVGSSGDVSEESKIVFNVPDVDDIIVLDFLDFVKSENVYIDLAPINNLSKVHVDFYAVGLNGSQLVTQKDFTTTSLSFDKSVLDYETNDFIIGIKILYTDNTESKIKYFKLNAF